jgi:hypothetical protein
VKNYILFLAISVCSFAYGQSFDGVPISGDLSTSISKFKQKGYTLSKYDDNGVIMKGKVANENVEVFIFTTMKTKVVFKLSVYFDEQSSWRSLKSQYDRFYEVLKGKYGEPDNFYTGFDDPYYEGDGYEMSAVALDKCKYSAYWLKKDNLSLAIEISKWKQINMSYENNENMELHKKERLELQKNSF